MPPLALMLILAATVSVLLAFCALGVNGYSREEVRGAALIRVSLGSATVAPHVNDPGFWLVSRFFGLSEKQTLQSWTVMQTIVGLVAFGVALVLSFFL